MILIDKKNQTQDIILNLGTGSHSNLVMIHDETRVEYTVLIQTNQSRFKSRFSYFKIDTSMFSAMAEGYYSFQVTDLNGENLECGKILILPTEQTPVEESTYTTPEVLVFTHK